MADLKYDSDIKDRILSYFKSGGKYNYSIAFVLIVAICSLMLSKSFTGTYILDDKSFSLLNNGFIEHLKKYKSNSELWSYLYNNLSIVIVNVFYIIMQLLTFKVVVETFFFAFILKKEKYSYCYESYFSSKNKIMNKIMIEILFLIIMSSVSFSLVTFMDFIFEEFALPMPKV